MDGSRVWKPEGKRVIGQILSIGSLFSETFSINLNSVVPFGSCDPTSSVASSHEKLV